MAIEGDYEGQYRLVPIPQDSQKKVQVDFIPDYTIIEEEEEPPIDESSHMALVFYAIYSILSMSDDPNEVNRSGRFYAMYKDYIENKTVDNEQGREDVTRVNKEFL